MTLGGFELNKVHLGDCIELMKQLPDKSVDCVITDPPYGLGNRLSDGGGEIKEYPNERFIQKLRLG